MAHSICCEGTSQVQCIGETTAAQDFQMYFPNANMFAKEFAEKTPAQ